MSSCRIYLFTYNRNDLLPRAIKSLLDQTYKNWVCELHNDMPENMFPKELLESLNDDRFILKNHDTNLGPLASFNLAFDNCDEKYISILEDDNWWETTFLETMVDVLDQRKDVNVAWSNMYYWLQEADGQWTTANETIWPVIPDLTFFNFQNYRKAIDALHSNGAMLVRNDHLESLKTPLKIRFDFIEHIRERAFKHPILLVNKPLANFAITINTSRAKNSEGRHEHFLLLLASYFRFFELDDLTLQDLWRKIRTSTVKSSNKLMYAGLADKNCRALLKKATIYDWFFFIAYNIRHPWTFYACMNAKRKYHELWNFLNFHTKLRYLESIENAGE